MITPVLSSANGFYTGQVRAQVRSMVNAQVQEVFTPFVFNPSTLLNRGQGEWQDTSATTISYSAGQTVQRWNNLGTLGANALYAGAAPTFPSTTTGATGNGSTATMKIALGKPSGDCTMLVRYKLNATGTNLGGIVNTESSRRLGRFGTGGVPAWYDNTTIYDVGTSTTATAQLMAISSKSGVATIYNASGSVVTSSASWDSATVADLYLLSERGSTNFSPDTVTNLFICNRALTASEIAKLYAYYNSVSVDPTISLTATVVGTVATFTVSLLTGTSVDSITIDCGDGTVLTGVTVGTPVAHDYESSGAWNATAMAAYPGGSATAVAYCLTGTYVYLKRYVSEFQDSGGTIPATPGTIVSRWDSLGSLAQNATETPNPPTMTSIVSGNNGGIEGNGTDAGMVVSGGRPSGDCTLIARYQLTDTSFNASGIVNAGASSRLGRFGTGGLPAWYDNSSIYDVGVSTTATPQIMAIAQTSGAATIYDNTGAVVTSSAGWVDPSSTLSIYLLSELAVSNFSSDILTDLVVFNRAFTAQEIANAYAALG